jgi:hypothetical protein
MDAALEAQAARAARLPSSGACQHDHCRDKLRQPCVFILGGCVALTRQRLADSRAAAEPEPDAAVASVEARQEATAEGGDSAEHTDDAAGADAQAVAGVDAKAAAVSRPNPSWNRSISTDIYLCHACSCQEILRTEMARQATEDALGKLAGKEAAALTSRLRSAGARLVLAADLEKMGDVRLQMRHFLLFSDGTLLFTKRGRRGVCELRR